MRIKLLGSEYRIITTWAVPRTRVCVVQTSGSFREQGCDKAGTRPLSLASAGDHIRRRFHSAYSHLKFSRGVAEDLQMWLTSRVKPKSLTTNPSHPRGSFHSRYFPQRDPACGPSESPFGDALLTLKLTAELSQRLTRWFNCTGSKFQILEQAAQRSG